MAGTLRLCAPYGCRAVGYLGRQRLCHLRGQARAVSLGIDSPPGTFSNVRAAAYLLLGNPLGFALAAYLVKGLSMNTKYRIDRRKALGLMGGAAWLVAVPGARVSA